MADKFEVRVALSAIATERGTNKMFLLLHEDPDTKNLTLPTMEVQHQENPGDVVVNLCKKSILAAPDWYSIAPTMFHKYGDTVYLIYATRMTSNIRTINNTGWFALSDLNKFQGRILPAHLKLVTIGINYGGNTR